MTENRAVISLVRWGLIAALTWLVLFDSLPPSPVELGFIAALFASALVLPRLPVLFPQVSPTAVSLSLDTVLVLVGLWIGNAASRDLLVAYFIAILLGSLGDSEKRVAGIAFLVTAAYALWAIPSEGLHAETPLLLRLPFLLLTTVFYGTMMQRLRTERRARQETERRVRELDCLLRVTRALGASLASRDVLERAAAIVRESLGVERCEIVLEGSAESPDPLALEAMDRRQTVRGGDGSALAVPILYELEPLGAIVVDPGARGTALTETESDLVEVVANATAPALQNVRHFEELLDHERSRSDVLLRLSRRFQVPATSILAYGELAKGEAEAHERLHHHLDEIVRHAEQIYEASEDVQKIAGLSLGHEARREGLVDVGFLLKEAIQAAKRMSGAPPVDVTLRLAPDLPLVCSDGEKLRRVLQSLLVRSFRSAGWGSISIEGELCAAPADGPTAATLLRLSIRDAQTEGEARTSPPSEIDDLSLLVSRRLAEFLGVAVRVDPVAGSGTRYEILIPVAA